MERDGFCRSVTSKLNYFLLSDTKGQKKKVFLFFFECQKFFFQKPNKTVFFRNDFQSTLLKHAGEVFFVLRNADFFKFKNAPELLKKTFAHESFIQRENNASCLISYFDVLL